MPCNLLFAAQVTSLVTSLPALCFLMLPACSDMRWTRHCLQAVGTFEGLLEEVTQYKESEKLLADPTAASGDMAIAEGLTFTNKAASSLHWASVKVGKSCHKTCWAASYSQFGGHVTLAGC